MWGGVHVCVCRGCRIEIWDRMHVFVCVLDSVYVLWRSFCEVLSVCVECISMWCEVCVYYV